MLTSQHVDGRRWTYCMATTPGQPVSRIQTISWLAYFFQHCALYFQAIFEGKNINTEKGLALKGSVWSCQAFYCGPKVTSALTVGHEFCFGKALPRFFIYSNHAWKSKPRKFNFRVEISSVTNFNSLTRPTHVEETDTVDTERRD